MFRLAIASSRITLERIERARPQLEALFMAQGLGKPLLYVSEGMDQFFIEHPNRPLLTFVGELLTVVHDITLDYQGMTKPAYRLLHHDNGTASVLIGEG